MKLQMTLALVAVAVLGGGCTYGKIEWGGDPVVGAGVSISNCDGESWYATTDNQGYYSLDGYEDDANAVSEGLILMMVTVGNVQRFDFHMQSYEACPDDPDKLCDRHDMDFGFKPVSGWEWQVWNAANDSHNTNAIYDFFAFCN